jgi:hypothetical protein
LTLNGWQRLWIVNTVAWVGYWLFSAGKTFYDYGWTKDAWEVLGLFSSLTLIPPIVLYATGMVIEWILLGFRPKT